MVKYQKAYLIQSEGIVVTNKALYPNTPESDFVEVQIALEMNEIIDWAEEIEMLGLDEEF